MEYMLIFSETTKEVSRKDDPNEAPAYWGAWSAYVQELFASGTVKSSNALQPPQTGTRVRIENGKRHVQDGPHPDAKEHFAGYFIIDVPNLDVALKWASKAPCASNGSVEVRPVLPPPPAA
jgi:hypothetical protein